jgi:hypothetical protein
MNILCSYYPFIYHIRAHKIIKPLILTFLHNLIANIRTEIWKTRNQNFKSWKISNNISKTTIKNYYKNNRQQSRPSHSQFNQNNFTDHISNNIIFILNDSLSNINNKVAYIYANTSNFLHNNGPSQL